MNKHHDYETVRQSEENGNRMDILTAESNMAILRHMEEQTSILKSILEQVEIIAMGMKQPTMTLAELEAIAAEIQGVPVEKVLVDEFPIIAVPDEIVKTPEPKKKGRKSNA